MNVFFVASPQELTIKGMPAFEDIHPSCRQQVKAAFFGLVKADSNHGILLTDDHNPAEYYDAANRERERRSLAIAMKQ
jgi:hypothetical protein